MYVSSQKIYLPFKKSAPKRENKLTFTGPGNNQRDVCFDEYDEAMSAYTRGAFLILTNKLPYTDVEFVRELVKNPANIQAKMNEYTSKSTFQAYMRWLTGPYQKAYADYTEQFYKEAKSVEELLTARPDWSPEKIIEKHKQLHGERPVRIGKIPKDLGSKKTFDKLVNYLYRYAVDKAYCEDNFEIPPITIGKKTFSFKPVLKGKTAKLPIVTTDNKGNRFMIKIDPSGMSGPLNFQLADSVALQAVIDYYLTANNCNNIAKLFYFDENYNAAIYEYIEADEKNLNFENPKNRLENILPDFYSLGMVFTDTIGEDNIFRKGDKHIIVDTGYSSFECFSRPYINGYHWVLPALDY